MDLRVTHYVAGSCWRLDHRWLGMLDHRGLQPVAKVPHRGRLGSVTRSFAASVQYSVANALDDRSRCHSPGNH